MDAIFKYPRTPHLEGSRIQPGDVDEGHRLADLPEGLHVWEEKIDGANSGISFDDDANMILQSRGHQLAGGARERQFDLLKRWTSAHEDTLFDILGRRYVMYNEWMLAKHTIFYDALPHYAFEMDVLDKETMTFLSTGRRRALFAGAPFVSVPMLHEGRLKSEKELRALIKPTIYRTAQWQESLAAAAAQAGVDPAQALSETDSSGLAEGLYLKIEDPDSGTTIARYKWVRSGFLQSILDSGSHWQARPIIANRLAPGIDIFAGAGNAVSVR